MVVDKLTNQELLMYYREAVVRLRTEVQTHEMVLEYAELHNEIMRRMGVN